MPVPDFGGLPPYANFEDVSNKVNDLVQRLRQLLLNLDTLNIKSLNAQVIIAGSITGDKIQANTITADKMMVNELSAISANLGHIVAGLIESVEIYGSYIATRRNAFPRCEMSATGNVFGAYNNASNHVTIEPNYGGSPAVAFTVAGTYRGRLHNLLGYPILEGASTLGLEAGSIIYVNTPRAYFETWDVLYANNPGRTLGDELREIFDRIEALEEGE